MVTMTQLVVPDNISLDDVLRRFIYGSTEPLLRKQKLLRDVIIGFIGDRGSGKSISGGTVALFDYLFQGEPCQSNLAVKANVEVPDEEVAFMGIPGGVVTYSSVEMDMLRFLHYGSEFEKCLIFLDEINVALADARRSITNQNLAADDVGQQLRKLNSGLTYTCIHEMFVDVRIRDMTDIFIKCQDTLFAERNDSIKQGSRIKWEMHAMTDKGAYVLNTEKDGMPSIAYLNAEPMWGTVDTFERKERKRYKVEFEREDGSKRELGEIDVERDPRIVQVESKWGWVADEIVKLHDQGLDRIKKKELWKILRLEERGINCREAGRYITGVLNVPTGGHLDSEYKLDQFDIKRLSKVKDEKKVVLV